VSVPVATPAAPLLVELVGLPGAGKSTLAEALLGELAARGACLRAVPRVGAAATRRVERARALVAAGLARPRLAAAALCLAGPDRSGLGRLVHLLGRVEQAEALAAEPAALVLLDEGPVQALWALATPGSARTLRRARALAADLLPRGRSVLVWLETPPAEAAARLSARSHAGARSRFDGRSTAELLPLLTAGAARLSSLVAATGLPVVRWPTPTRSTGVAEAFSAALPGLLEPFSHPAGLHVVSTARWAP
jgi:hypothetical protein